MLQLALVGDREHGTQPCEIDIVRADVVMGRHDQPCRLAERSRRILARDSQHRVLRRYCALVDEIADDTLRFADDRRVRLAREVAYGRRMPVVAAGEPRRDVHSLLYDGPLARARHDEAVEINLKAIGDRVVVDARRQPTRLRERLAVDAAPTGNGPEL